MQVLIISTLKKTITMKGQGTESQPCKDRGPPSSNRSTTTHVRAVTMIKLSKHPMQYTIILCYGWWRKFHIAREHRNPTTSGWVPKVWDWILFTDISHYRTTHSCLSFFLTRLPGLTQTRGWDMSVSIIRPSNLALFLSRAYPSLAASGTITFGT
jgi:hypothetical protein